MTAGHRLAWLGRPVVGTPVDVAAMAENGVVVCCLKVHACSCDRGTGGAILTWTSPSSTSPT